MPSATLELVSRIALKWIEKRPFSKEGKQRRKARRAQRKAERDGAGGEFLVPTEEDEEMGDSIIGALKSKLVWLGIVQLVWSAAQSYMAGTFTAEAAATTVSGVLTIVFRAMTNKPLAEK